MYSAVLQLVDKLIDQSFPHSLCLTKLHNCANIITPTGVIAKDKKLVFKILCLSQWIMYKIISKLNTDDMRPRIHILQC